MQPVGLVTGQDLLLRGETRLQIVPALRSGFGTSKVLGVGLLEKPAGMPFLAFGVVILNGKHTLPEGARYRARVRVDVVAAGAGTPTAFCRSGHDQLMM